MAAWGGATVDTTRNWLVVHGGGHGDYAGNEIYIFDLNTQRWSRLWGPTPNASIPSASANEGQETYLNGDPSSVHTYDGLEYLPSLGKIWRGGGSLWSGSGGGSRASWYFDPASLTWQRRADSQSLGVSQVSAYDPVTGHIFGASDKGSLHEYDPSANTWTSRGAFGVGEEGHAVIDPQARVFVAVGNGLMRVHDIAASITRAQSTSGPQNIVGARGPGLAYDSALNRIVGWAGGTSVYSLDASTWTWTAHPAASTNVVTPTPPTRVGVFGRFAYVPSKNIYLLVNSVSEPVYAYKLSSGTPVPSDTTPPSTPTGLTATPTSATSVALSWSASSDQESGIARYHVYRNGTLVATALTTSHANISLAPSTTYLYQVSAVNGSNLESTKSASVSATTPALAPGGTLTAIHVGGAEVTATDGTVYIADQYGSGGQTYLVTTAIANTADDAIYQTQRYGNFSYTIPAPTGTYTVTLKFSEIYWDAAGLRVFNVQAEGQPIITNLDVFQQVGAYAAYDVSVPVMVSDGNLNLVFQSVVDNAVVSGIKVVSGGVVPPPDATAPSSPTGVTATAVSSSQINLAWTASTDNVGVTGYRVLRCQGTGCVPSLLTTLGNVTSYQNTGLAGTTTYTYTVVALDAAGNASAPSSATSATTLSGATPGGWINLPLRTWTSRPLPVSGLGPYAIPYEGKHSRILFDSKRGRMVWAAGDYYSLQANGGGSNLIWSIDLSDSTNTWTLVSPWCNGPVQPGVPDTVGWAYDSNRDRGIMTPGFYFSTQGATPAGHCGSSTSYTNDAMSFDFSTNTWRTRDFAVPSDGWGGDNGSSYSTYDPVTDALIRFRGQSRVEIFSLATGAYEAVTLTGIGQYPEFNRNMPAIDVTSRAIYLIDRAGRSLLKYSIPDKRVAQAIPLPSQWIPPTGGDMETYLVFDPINRVILNPVTTTFGDGTGNLPGMAIYHVDTNTWEWEAIPSSVSGNLLGFDPAHNAMLFAGRSNLELYWLYRYGNGSGAGSGLRGDLDGDSDVDLDDLRRMIFMLVGTVPKDLLVADLDGDGQLLLVDLQILVKLLVGIP
jgi:chitodextrinase